MKHQHKLILVLATFILTTCLVLPSIHFANASNLLVTINFESYIGTNLLEIGTQTDYGNTLAFASSSTFQNEMQTANVKFIRVFLSHIGYNGRYSTQPCRSWSDTNKTGSWVWTDFDNWADDVFSIGATPLIVIGYAGAPPNGLIHLPFGMGLNSITHLPNPDTFAAYCKAIVQHFMDTNKNVTYYEVVNEPVAYYGWTPDPTLLGYMMALYNASYAAMKSVNPNLSIAFDSDAEYSTITYLVNNNVPIDRIDYHKYDTYTSPDVAPSDSQLFASAETMFFVNRNPYTWSVQNAASWYQTQTGKKVPIWDTESNMNSFTDGGSDPRMVQMAGTLWDALKIRAEILSGVSVDIHFTACANSNFEKSKTPYGGYGFGMTDSDNNYQPWDPYWFYAMVFNNLQPGDWLCSSTSTSSKLRTLAWQHDDVDNLLLIHASNATDTVTVTGFAPGDLTYMKVDNTISYLQSQLQTGNTSSTITLYGYTVMLLQQGNASVGPSNLSGDVNRDGLVDMKDIAIVARCFGSTPSSSNWNPNADIDGDGEVAMRDLAIVVRNLGEHYP